MFLLHSLITKEIIDNYLEEKVDYNAIEKVKNIIYNNLPVSMSENDKYYNSILIAYFSGYLRDSLNNDLNDNERIFINEKSNNQLLNEEYLTSEFTNIQKETFSLLKKYPNAFKSLSKRHNKNLVEYLLNAENLEKCLAQSSLQTGIIKLVLALLEIENGSSVANFNAGTGIFENIAILQNKKCKFFMFDTNRQNRMIAGIRKNLLLRAKNAENDVTYSQFQTEIFDKFNDGRKFDRVFCNIPIGTSVRFLEETHYWKEFKKQWYYQKLNVVDWVYCERMVDMLSPNGIAVALVSNGATYNNSDMEVRKELLRKGFIKAVIQMPQKLLKGSNINFSIVVLSKGNKSVKMIDASSLYCNGRRYNILTDNYVKGILNLYKQDSLLNNKVKELCMEDIAKEDYSLNPNRYINKEYNVNCVKLKDLLVSEISRGMNISANQLDNISLNSESGYKFLTLSSINNGIICKDMISIQNPNLKSNKYIVENNNIVIAKTCNPIKIAVLNNEENYNIVASDNIFVLKVDESKVKPYYLKAFFESETGKREITRASSGTVTTTITKQQLENILVPLKSMDKQNEIAENYKYNEQQIKLIKERLALLQDKLKDIWRAEDDD